MQVNDPVVVVVTNDRLSQKLICQNLIARDYAVTTVTSADEAVALLTESHPPDLVVLDITTPAPAGFGQCLAIRRIIDAPIIVLSTSAKARDRNLAMKLGASAYLTKPFGLQSLIHEMQRFLNQPASNLPGKELAAVV